MLPDQNVLADMLRYKRPAGSKTERAFNQNYLDCIEGMNHDAVGNRWIAVGNTPIIWSSHTDTVHTNGGMQGVFMTSDKHNECFATSDSQDCLGADCTTGVFIMLHMLKCGVEGLYLFHAEEEHGCKGSRAIAVANKTKLGAYKAAVAFDRKAKTNIITHQMSSRTCSDDFANSLANQLGQGYKGDDTGSYTDTYSYHKLVSECTNISVGYYSQHTKSECQDVDHALWLADKMTKIDLSKLVFARDPSKEERKESWADRYYGNGYRGYDSSAYQSYKNQPPSLYTMCRDFPWIASAFMEHEALCMEDMVEFLKKKYPNHVALYRLENTMHGEY